MVDPNVPISPTSPTPPGSPTSPVVEGDELMNFSQALVQVLAGGKIHKLEWKDKAYFALMKDSVLQLHKPDGIFYAWTLSEGDLIGNDYIVLK